MINKFRFKQSGEGITSLLFTLTLIGIVILLALRIVPLYIEYFQVASSLEGIAEESVTSKKSLLEIKKNLLRRIREINDVERVSDEHITIAKKKGLITITVNYEARVPLVANFDLIATFNKSVEVHRVD